jgi:hypothetical protein
MSVARFSLVSFIVVSMGTFSATFAEPPGSLPPDKLVILDSRPRAISESLAKNWPNRSDTMWISAHFNSPPNSGGYQRSSIQFTILRYYLVGDKQLRTNFSYGGGVGEPRPGETFPLFNAIVKVWNTSPGEDATAMLQIMDDEYSRKSVGRLGKGFFLSERAGITESATEGKSFELEQVQTALDDPKSAVARIKYGRSFKTENLPNLLKVGDRIEMLHLTLRLIDIEPADTEAKRRGWIVLEPVLPEPVNIPD